MIQAKIQPSKNGIAKSTVPYDYREYFYDWMEFLDVKGPNGRYWDMGLDHFILTENGDFDRIEFRIM